MTTALESVREALSARYRVEREIGRGGTAAVYLAYDTRDQRPVAIKVLNQELAQALGAQRFLREIRTAASLQHPHLVPIHDSGEIGDRLYYVSPYLPDGSLRARLDKERQLSIEDAIQLATDVGSALAHIHANGIIHRDIKPENILFSGDSACVADFGIARAVDSGLGDTITATGLVVGTPTYMSPEQASADRAVDPRSDQYSLACVLYEAIAGVPPFIGASAQAVIAQRFSHTALPLSHYRPAVPAYVEAAIARALSLTPADRFPDVRSFIAALTDRSSMTWSATALPVAERSMRRRLFGLGAGTVVLVLALLGFGGGYERVQAALSPALDTARFAVVPFTAAAGPLSGSDVSDALYLALRQWNGLNLAEDGAVRDALGRQQLVASLDDALSLGASLRAGRVVWGRVSPQEDGAVVRADLYDVRTRRSLRQATAAVSPGADLSTQLAPLADALLRHPGLAGPADGDLGTRSYPARVAYESGEIAYARGGFADARDAYAAAVAADPNFARAQLRLALLGLLLDQPAEAWRESARRAENATALPPRERALAAGLLALAEDRHPEACSAFARAHGSDSADFAVWYALGECRSRDEVVVPIRQSPSGWAFRTGYHTATLAYLRAVDTDHRAYALPVYARLRQMLKTDRSQLRSGAAASGSFVYAGYPALAGDTLAFIPYEIRGHVVPTAAAPDPAVHERAMERSSSILLGFVRTWNARRPDDTAGLLALADVLELRGEVATEHAGQVGALEAIRRARAATVDPAELLLLRLRELRLLVRAGSFADAGLLADSLLTGRIAASGEAGPQLLALAAMTGRLDLTERLAGRSPRLSQLAGAELPAPLAARAAALDARAAMGACTELASARTELDAAVDAFAPRARWSALKAELLALPSMWAASCTGGSSATWSPPTPGTVAMALRRYAEGNHGAARRQLDALESASAMLRPGDISLDYSFAGAWLRAALGDTAAAAAQLDRLLQSLPTHRGTLFTRMSEAAALPRAMVLRAELAAASGDSAVARKWAAAMLSLWRNPDPAFAPTIARMRSLARQR